MGVYSETADLARAARLEILKMTSKASASHVGSALSVVDILASLYSGVAKISPNNFESQNRDIVLLSKGHAASALYSILALQDFFPLEWLERYCENGAELGGHVTAAGVLGVELSTGSLGHGLPYGLGIAKSRKLFNTAGRVFVVISDGECDEGTTWESALFANHHNLDNLCVIIDRNRIQSLEGTESTLRLDPLDKKWESFGWKCRIINGHDYVALENALAASDKPLVVIAETLKGKGVDFMENSVAWHYKSPNSEDLAQAISQIQQVSDHAR
jgi:transketolase